MTWGLSRCHQMMSLATKITLLWRSHSENHHLHVSLQARPCSSCHAFLLTQTLEMGAVIIFLYRGKLRQRRGNQTLSSSGSQVPTLLLSRLSVTLRAQTDSWTCVIQGMSLHLSEPYSPHQQNEVASMDRPPERMT